MTDVYLKGSSDAHFPQVDMNLYCFYNILWLKFLNGCDKIQFYPVRISAVFLFHVALNANELCWLRPSLPWAVLITLAVKLVN